MLLTGKQVRKLLDMKEVLGAVENAFRHKGLGKVQMPAKVYLFYEKFNGDLRTMPSYVEDMDVSAVKIVNVHPDNAKNYGLVFTAYGAGAIIGGIVSAQAKDLLGAYQPFFLIVAALAVLGMVVAFMLMKPPVRKAA